jgi:activator of HSP90 ATPase
MDIRKNYVIAAPVEAVWAALTDPAVIEGWGGGPAEMAAQPGFEFSLWGGDIHGTVLAVDPPRSMTQEWFGGDWGAPSIARFTLMAGAHGLTTLELENTGVPDEEGADIDAGWDEYYFRPMKSLLESSD